MWLGEGLCLVGFQSGDLRVGCRVLPSVSPGCHLVGTGNDTKGKIVFHFHQFCGGSKEESWPRDLSCHHHAK